MWEGIFRLEKKEKGKEMKNKERGLQNAEYEDKVQLDEWEVETNNQGCKFQEQEQVSEVVFQRPLPEDLQ